MIRKMLYVIFCFLFFGALTSCQELNRDSKYISLNMIPMPKEQRGKMNDKNEYIAYEYKATIKTESESFRNALNAFCDYSERILDLSFEEHDKAEIILAAQQELLPGAYKIVPNNKNVKIYASNEEGINNALATMLQIMQKSDNGVFIPKVKIFDYPDSIYRGMMVDLAREWHEFEYLINFVDMCYFYKLSVLHLHFTDDQSYTLPSDVYPKLPSVNRHYTKEQINELVEYAHKRGIELVPEIDIPGHCQQFQKAYPSLFGFGGIIHQHEDSFVALEEIFAELCEMFKYSKYIHIGGDEAAIQQWTQCKKCRDYADTKGIDSTISDKSLLSEQMLAHFVTRIANVVFENDKKPIAWEGFAKEVNDMVPKEIIIMSWENYYQLTPDLIDAGFKIINCSWDPMYVITPIRKWPIKDVFEWDIYSWKPVHPQSPYINTGGIKIEHSDNVLGGQLLAWNRHIEEHFENAEDGIKEEMLLLLERIPALSENTWNNEKVRTFDEFIIDAEVLQDRFKPILRISE